MLPHPSSHEIIISTELLVYGLALRWTIHKVQTEAIKEKRRIYKHHNKQHSGWFRFCRQGECLKLTKSRSSTQSQEDLPLLLSAEEQLL